MKLFRTSFLTAIVGLTASLSAQNQVLPYLPKGTIAAISAPDLQTSYKEFQQMPLAKMFAEPDTQKFLADVRELAKKKFDELMTQAKEMHSRGELPVDPADLLKLEVRGATLAMTQFEMKVGDFGPMPKVGVLLHLDFGPTTAQWHSLVALGLSMLEGAAGPKLTKTENKVGDWAVRSYMAADVQGMETGLHVVMVPNGLLIGTLLEDVTAFAQNLQKKTVGLGGADDYQALAKHLQPDGAEVETFLRWDSLVDIGLQMLTTGAAMEPKLQHIDMAGVQRAVAAMGLRQLGVTGSTSKYVDGKSVSRTFRTRPVAKGDDGKTAVAAKTIDTAFLKWVPKDAVYFDAQSFDILGVWDAMVKGLKAYDPELATKMMTQLDEHEKQLGFKIRDDLFGAIGDHWITWSMPVGSVTAAPEATMLLRVNNEQKLVGALQNLVKLSNGAVDLEETEKRGMKTWQIHVNADPTNGMGGFNIFEMFQPTFAFKNGYLVAGFSAADVKRVFQRMDREDDPKNDIRSNKEYAAVAANLPAGASAISFTDWKTQFESFYQVATGLLALVPMGEEVPIDMQLLPDSATLTKHLFGSVGYTKVDADGEESVLISPFGTELMVGLVALVGIGAGIGAANSKRF